MTVFIPPALVLGCNTPHGIGVLSDWIEEHVGEAPDFTSKSWSSGFHHDDETGCGHQYGESNGEGYGAGYSFTPEFSDGNGYGAGYEYVLGRLEGDGSGHGWATGHSRCYGSRNCTGDGYGRGDSYYDGNGGFILNTRQE